MTTHARNEVSSTASDRKWILVVADDPATRSLLGRVLEERYRIEAVDDGQAALEAIGRQAPDLVLTTRMKPPLDGLGLLREIRSNASTSGIPVVLLSSQEEEDFRIEGLQAGADDHLTKPFGARELLARVTFQLNASHLRFDAARREHALRVRSDEDRKALQASEARFRTLVRQSRDGIIIVDGSGTIVEWNEGEEQITGISRAEAVNRPIWEVQLRLAPEAHRNADYLRVAKEKALAGLGEGAELRRNLEEEIQRPDGTRRTIESFLFAIQSGGDLFAAGISRDITERKRNEKMLRTSEERLSLAVEASSLGLWDWDIAADTAYLSPEYLRLSGYEDAEVHPALAFFRSIVHPADLPHVESTMREHLEGKSQRSALEYRMRKKSGEYSWVRGVGRLTARDDRGAPTRMTGTIADITESRRLEEELRERQALLLEAERLAHVGHWDRDLRSDRSFWSNEVYRILGYAPGSVVPGREAFLQAIDLEDRQRIGEAISATARDGVTRRAEYRIVDAHGAVRCLSGTVELLRDSRGLPARIIGTVQDITERKMAEAEREMLLEALRATDKNKNEFMAMLSHELRNPLAPIKNSLYILDRAEPGGDQGRRALAVINRQVGQLARLVDDLLDVTRISRNKIVLQRQDLELNELVRRTMEDYRSLFEKNELRLELVPAAQPVLVNADGNRLAQVVGNLLSNAAKFTERRGRTTVSVASDLAAGQAVIRVADTGVGMTPEMLARLFQPFVQADTALHRATGGLGLGLALAKGLVELHGGEVTANSAGLGKGSEVVVRLPLALPQVKEPQPRRGSPERIRRRVLIIEDNIDAAESLREALEFGEHEVAVAYNGPEGIEKARELRPDVLLCDIGLPGMDGYEVARALRADHALDGVVLVALSGYALPEDLQRAQEAGFDGHLAKPPSLEKLETLLAEAPQRSTESREADSTPQPDPMH